MPKPNYWWQRTSLLGTSTSWLAEPLVTLGNATSKTVHCQPFDSGHGSVRRFRGWTIALRKEVGRFIAEPQDIDNSEALLEDERRRVATKSRPYDPLCENLWTAMKKLNHNSFPCQERRKPRFFLGPGWLQIFPQQPFRKVIHVHHPTSGAKRIRNDSVYLLGLYKKTRSCLIWPDWYAPLASNLRNKGAPSQRYPIQTSHLQYAYGWLYGPFSSGVFMGWAAKNQHNRKQFGSEKPHILGRVFHRFLFCQRQCSNDNLWSVEFILDLPPTQDAAW